MSEYSDYSYFSQNVFRLIAHHIQSF